MSDLRTGVQKLSDAYQAKAAEERAEYHDTGDKGTAALASAYEEFTAYLDAVLGVAAASLVVSLTLLPEGYERTGPISGAVVEYQVADGPWTHGWSLWQHEATDPDIVKHYRKAVRERHTEPGVTVRTRVRFYSEED